jgi:hypothetical protein
MREMTGETPRMGSIDDPEGKKGGSFSSSELAIIKLYYDN